MRKREDPIKHRERDRRYRAANRAKYNETQRKWREANRAYWNEWRRVHSDYVAQYNAAHRDDIAAIQRKRRAVLRLRAIVDAGFGDMAAPPEPHRPRCARRIIGNAMTKLGDRAFPAGIEMKAGYCYLAAMCLWSADAETWPKRGLQVVQAWGVIANNRGRNWYIDRLREASDEARRMGAPEWAVEAICQPSEAILTSKDEDEE